MTLYWNGDSKSQKIQFYENHIFISGFTVLEH